MLVIPLRKKSAAAQPMKTKLRGDAILKVATEVKTRFTSYRPSNTGRLKAINETDATAVELAPASTRRNINDLDLANQQATYSQSN